MTTTKEQLPRRAARLEALANKYDDTDMSEVIDNATVIDEPMTTISLRVPVALIEDLKREALAHKAKHTVYARRLLEQGLHSNPSTGLTVEQIMESVNQSQPLTELAESVKQIQKALDI